MLQLFKEQFVGSYDGVTPSVLLPAGSLSDGENVRKVGKGGGWKPRKGCTINNTTTIGAHNIYSLHQYTHPRLSDYHFLAQVNGNIYDATNDPPASGTTFGSSLYASASTTTPGFSCIVKDRFFYGDGSGGPITWGGDGPYCVGFIAHFDIGGSGADTYVDYTREVTDGRSGTEAVLSNDADDVYYVCSPEIAEKITLDLGATVNAETATLTLSSWQSGAWSDRSATDGTLDGGATHAVDGDITWTRSASDTMRVIGGLMGYWYRVSFSAALTDAVKIISCKVGYDMTTMTNKWNGEYEFPSGVRFYDQSTTEYVEVTGKVTNESISQYLDLAAATTSDYLYIKTIEPATGFGIAIVDTYEQTDDAQIDQIDVWIGSEWTAVTTGITDETLDEGGDSSFAQTGVVWFNAAAVSAKRRTFDFDSVPGYWYRLSWDAALSDPLRVFMVNYAPFPEAIATADGCVEFKGRLFTWGDPEFPNRLRYSALDKPDCLSGSDSGYTDPFGDMSKVTCAIPFYNELIVFKEKSVWLLEGYAPFNFGSLKIADTVGLASPKSALVIETGFPGMHKDEPMSICIWQDIDGIYVLDGRKPRKVSLPVDHYFNSEYSTCIAAASIKNRQAFPDRMNNEYHFLLPSEELVYNYILDEWFPPWDRKIDLVTGITLRGTDDRYYTYGGSAGGLVMKLETDTTDKTTANADEKIEHSIKSRAISPKAGMSTTMRFTFRKVWVEAKAITTPTVKTVTTTFFKNLATSGTALTVPGAVSLEEVGYGLAPWELDTSQENCLCFQLLFAASTVDLEMEIWSFLYLLDARGEIVI